MLLVHSLAGGGAERVIVNLANQFASDGHRVQLVTTRRGVYFEQLSANVTVMFLPFQRKLYLLNVLAIALLLRRSSPHVLMSTLMLSNIVSPIARALARVPTKVMILEQNTLHRYRVNSMSLRRRAALALMRHTYALADTIVANSEDTAKDLAAFGVMSSVAVKIIPNPVWDESLIQRGECGSDHDALKDSRPILLSVGRLDEQKDFETLIRAVVCVQSRRAIRAVILGTGPMEPRLMQLIRELNADKYIALAGFQSNPYPFYKRATIFCLSSRWEGFGNVLIEALGFGLPIVATDCAGGPRVILDNGTYGRLVPVADEQAMADAIVGILDSPTQFPSSKQVDRASQFGIQQIANEYVTLARLLVNSSRS